MSITANNSQVRQIINQVVNDPDYRDIAKVPLVSWHQLVMIVASFSAVIGGMIAIHYYDSSLWLVYPIMIFAFYTSFTPLHDATHRAVSSDERINDWLGSLSGNLLFPFVTTEVYRFLHLAHHRYVGDKDLDPDEAMVAIPTRYFPFGYLVLLVPEVLWINWLFMKAWKRAPKNIRFYTLCMFIGNFIFHAAWLLSPLSTEYFYLFFLPNRLAILYVAFTFAHTPHPEGVKWNDYPFQATFKLRGNKLFLESLFGQEHHAMHHLLPHIPWYKYHKAWNLANGIFKEQSIPQKKVFSIPDKHFKDLITRAENGKSIFKVKIIETTEVADGVKTFKFIPQNGLSSLPNFSAGSHINVHLPSGKRRSYSLVNAPYEQSYYQIAVKKEEKGKGGSIELHKLTVGDVLEISHPENNFILYENARNYILISGGIGITPLLSMSHRLHDLEKHFELHVCARSKEQIPFLHGLRNWSFAPNVEIHLDDAYGHSSIDLDVLLNNPSPDTLIYTCGPQGFNEWIKSKSIEFGWQENQIMQELFIHDQHTFGAAKPFLITLATSNKEIVVQEDQTIIDALHMNNIQVSYSCMQGTCGTCVTNVIEGKIEHRDAYLSKEEKTRNEKMCICVSRAQGKSLTLDR